ncbi:hypothetical protein KIL84_004360 [Mauremys mutica]|uniref:Uncharacterized protein n=1 Tax=Mauremys mutica TaxID=74926 RepID=A0A9D3XMX1_9SAUR|nr:hypothetical protein KIL84_004360 [Mauremys mutica]
MVLKFKIKLTLENDTPLSPMFSVYAHPRPMPECGGGILHASSAPAPWWISGEQGSTITVLPWPAPALPPGFTVLLSSQASQTLSLPSARIQRLQDCTNTAVSGALQACCRGAGFTPERMPMLVL